MADNWQNGIVIVGILFIIMAMFSLGRNRKKRSATKTTGRDLVDRARQKQGVRDELEALMVDINRMAKDLGAQLDAKVIRIEHATREADERIAQLQALRHELSQQAVQPPPPITQAPQLAAEPVLQEPQSHADPLTREVYALADQGMGPNDIAEQLGEHIGKVELILALRTG